MMNFEMFSDCPIAKLVEQNESSMVGIDFLEGSLSICHLNSILGQHGYCYFEFLLTNPTVIVGVYCIKGCPILVVLSQIKKQIFELGLRYIVISMCILCLEHCLGNIEGSDNDRLELEKFRKLNHISESLIDLSKTQIAIVVDINIRPVLISLIYFSLRVTSWQLHLNFFPRHLKKYNRFDVSLSSKRLSWITGQNLKDEELIKLKERQIMIIRMWTLQCRIMWQFKPKTLVARILVNISIIYSIFQNPELMERVCGPFTLPIAHKHNLILLICYMELFRIGYEAIISYLQRWSFFKNWKLDFADFLTVKYLIILFAKIWLIFDESHRKKFYLHTILLEGAIICSAILLDCFNRNNIKEVGELLIIEGLHRLALVYVLTQTFCPNLILYYSVTNLLVFILSQVEAQSKYGLNKSLYVKHDIYRFLFLSLAFFAVTSLTQISSYGVKMLVIFMIGLKWHVGSIRNYNQAKFLESGRELFGVIVIFSICEALFTFYA